MDQSAGSYGSVPNRQSPTSTKQPKENQSPLLVREEDRFRLDTPYQDKIFGILFVTYLILIILLSFYFYIQNSDSFNTSSSNTNNDYLNQHFWRLTIYSILISIFNSILLLFILRKYTYHLIWFTLILSIIIWLTYGIILLFIGSIITGIFVLIIAILQIIWVYFIKSRIEFATSLIILSIDALNVFSPYSYGISFIGILLQTMWLIIWMIGFSYSIDGTDSTKTVIVLYIIAYYWTFQVISNIVLCTVSGIVAVWYFLYPSHIPSNTIYNSFKRSITTSFGSICYGSLIVAIVQTIRIFINMLRATLRDNNNNICLRCIACIVDSLLHCIQDIIEYVNNYAYVRISIYGQNYCLAAKQTLNLFKSRGFDIVINDDLTNSVLILSSLLSAIFTALIIGIISKYSFNNNSIDTVILWSATAFAISFAVTMSVMITIKAAVSTIFVSFAEDPAALSFTKPPKYEFLTNAWNKRYGALPRRLTNPPRTI